MGRGIRIEVTRGTKRVPSTRGQLGAMLDCVTDMGLSFRLDLAERDNIGLGQVPLAPPGERGARIKEEIREVFGCLRAWNWTKQFSKGLW